MVGRFVSFLKRLWSAAPVATVILALALTASAVFAVRATVFWLHRPPLAERELAVEAWMTPRYVARSWGMSPRRLAKAIGAPIPPPDGPMSLSELAELRGVPVAEIIAEAEAAIAEFRAERGDTDTGQ